MHNFLTDISNLKVDLLKFYSCHHRPAFYPTHRFSEQHSALHEARTEFTPVYSEVHSVFEVYFLVCLFLCLCFVLCLMYFRVPDVVE